MNWNRRVFTLSQTSLLLVLVLLVGCGQRSKTVKVYPVRGEIFVQGDPVSGATVHFHPVDKEMPAAYAVVQDDGSFELSTYANSDGAAAGDYIVTVAWRDETPGEGETIIGPDRLGDRYSNREKSSLKATINEEQTVLDAFELQAK